MRLLRADNYKLEQFQGQPPPYAILSHTWAEQEVTFDDFDNPRRVEMKGWMKITAACRLALVDGWEYVWIDTCCIDKKSSAELSENINAMFRYYEQAGICYAYLEDVDRDAGRADGRTFLGEQFEKSRWFTRGWTLQELLAPKTLLFLDKSWKELGFRKDWALYIEWATSIKVEHMDTFKSCSIGTKFSWAQNRCTLRIEDRAYSLLGLFGISMPLIYGEGDNAFQRLQLEIMKVSDDESIFAWNLGSTIHHGRDIILNTNVEDAQDDVSTLLAPSPSAFTYYAMPFAFDSHRRGFAITNAGLAISAELWKAKKDRSFALLLNCTHAFGDDKLPLMLSLLPDRERSNRFRRASALTPLIGWSDSLKQKYDSVGKQDILIAHQAPTSHNVSPGTELNVALVCRPENMVICKALHVYSSISSHLGVHEYWSDGREVPKGNSIYVPNGQGLVAMLEAQTKTGTASFVVALRPAAQRPSFGITRRVEFPWGYVIGKPSQPNIVIRGSASWPKAAFEFASNMTMKVSILRRITSEPSSPERPRRYQAMSTIWLVASLEDQNVKAE